MPSVTTQLVAGQPIWAKLFYLVRTGHPQEAIDEANRYQQAIDHREPSFLANFKTWLESPDRKYVPKNFFVCYKLWLNPSGCRNYIGTISNPHIMATCFILRQLILSNLLYTN